MSINNLGDSYGLTYPYVYKRTWLLTKDDTSTSKDVFAAVQVVYTGTATVIVCLEAVDGTPINPILVPFSGAIVPIVGKGYVSTGSDVKGNSFTTDAAIIQVFGLGGI